MLPDGVTGFGSILETNLIGTISLVTGALPAEFGLRTVGLVDITTRTDATPDWLADSIAGETLCSPNGRKADPRGFAGPGSSAARWTGSRWRSPAGGPRVAARSPGAVMFLGLTAYGPRTAPRHRLVP